MRIRKRPWHEEILNRESTIYIKNPVNLKGRWKTVLNCDILHVEIGAGKGDYAIKMAQMYPNHGFVAIEKVPLIGSYILKKANESIPNLKVIIADANDIAAWFDENEIDIIHLNFSDPWPKKRHHKHRLTTQDFLSDYRKILSDEGKIIQKSDNRTFFEDSCSYLSQNLWILEEISLNFRETEQNYDAISEYEERFIKLGQPIYRAIWRK